METTVLPCHCSPVQPNNSFKSKLNRFALELDVTQALGPTTMLHELWNSWQFDLWLKLACLVAGIAVISPFLLSKSFRKWFSRIDMDLEALGLATLILAVVIIGLYNWFVATKSGA